MQPEMTRCFAGGKPRILIADDNEGTRCMLRLITEREFLK